MRQPTSLQFNHFLINKASQIHFFFRNFLFLSKAIHKIVKCHPILSHPI